MKRKQGLTVFFITLLIVTLACGGETSDDTVADPINSDASLGDSATATPLPPTATPNPNVFVPGTYLVGSDLQAGIYTGEVGTDIFDSCYWERLEDLSGEFGAIISNDNSIGLFYIEILESDFALTVGCEIEYLPTLPGPASTFPNEINPGTYLVGIDIQPGTYQGQAGEDVLDSCYWERLSHVNGDFDGIIANDNAVGQYYVQISSSDFAFSTACSMVRVGD